MQRILASLAALAAAAPSIAAQVGSGLGTLSFPTSATVPAAQEAFQQGVLLLHSFEYTRAQRAFQQAQRLAPGFAMAYWGEAMTYTHPVWNEQDLPAARAVLARLGGGATTPRERGYLAAVAALYGEGTKPRRDTLYAQAMERMVRDFPADLEAKAFYALALLGLNQGVRDTVTYLRAGPYADTVFRANPNHPGAVHYLIHAYDDAIHAPMGLAAARAYIGIAPDAAHAQHMTTHIFLAMGMWDEVVSQNTIAMKLQAELPGHYTSWLIYGLIQQGRYREARELTEKLSRNLGDGGNHTQHSALGSMWGHYLINAGALAGISALPPSAHPLSLTAQLGEAYVRGILAFREHDTSRLAAARKEVDRLAHAVQGEYGASDPAARAAQVMRHQTAGRLALVSGDEPGGLRALRAAAELEDAMPMEFGPPVVMEPSHELLGSILAGIDPVAARRELEQADRLAPGRSLTLMGLWSAALARKDPAAARAALDRLDRNWAKADPLPREALDAMRQAAARRP